MNGNNQESSSQVNTVLIVILLLLVVGFGVWWFTVRTPSTDTEKDGINVDVNFPKDNSSNPSSAY